MLPPSDSTRRRRRVELRPRRLRDAATLWSSLRSRKGPEARDAVWAHPDLLPTSADLDDPLGFGEQVEIEEIGDSEFDAALADLLDQEAAGRQAPDGSLAALAATPTHLGSVRSAKPLVARVLFDVVM